MADNQQYGPLAPKKTSASDIRSVIANATKETGKGFTIANKEEIEQKKQDNGLNVKVSNGVKTNPKVELTNNTKPTSVINTPTQKKEAPTGPVVSPVVSASQLTGDVFKNPQLQPIENIKVQKNNDEPKLSNSYTNYHLNKDEIRNMLVESQEDKIKRKSEGIEKLYIDAYRKKKNGEVLTIEEVLGNANYQKELNGIEQGKLQEMINDANAIANAGKFNMDNVIPLFEKYQDEGIQVDYNKLSPQSKAQFVGDMLNNKQSTIGKIISLGTPLGQLNSLKELITGKSFLDDIQDAIIDLENTSHKNLTDKEADKIASKQIKELDEGFKDFYDMGKKSHSLIDYATNIEDAPKMYYENKYGVAKDQKIWKDKEKEREYNEKLDEIRRLVKEQHGDTPENVAKNTLIGSAKALLTVYNMASDLPSFGKMIWDLGKGGVEDFVGSAVSLGKTAYDTAKYGAETGDFEVQWDAKDIRQRVAESGGYDNYKDMVAKLEKEWGDNPLGQFAVWSLKNADTSMDTANALGNYFMEKYGSLDKGWTAFKNDPVEVISDWMPAMQFKVSLLNKLGFISDLNATKILNASRWLDAYDKPFELANKLQFGPLLKAEGKLLGGISKLGLNSIKLPVKAVASITDAVISKLTGIDKESRSYIRENGDAVLDYVNGKETSDGILREITDKFDELTDDKKQIGEEYNIIKESDVPVNSKSVMDDIYSKLSEYGVKINTDGSVEFSKILPTSIKGKVNELVSYINDFQKKGDTPSASDTHYFRQLVDNLTNWDNPNPKGLDAQFINTLKDIRKTIDGALKEQVPGMKEADAAYSKTVSLIQELKKDWFNKDGTLKDGAYSKIRNLTNKGSNQPKLERLEKIIPGITGKLKSLAVSEVIERGMKQATGQYLNQLGLGGSVFSLFTGGVSLTPMVLGILGANLATPKNFAHLLRFEGKVTKPIRNLADKIKNGNKLNAKETKDLVDFMLDNKEGLKETAKYMNERGLFDEPTKASDTKAPKSKDPTLKELTDYKESLKKDLKEGKITKEYYDDEIHGKNGEPGIDYAIAQKKARVKAGDKEHVLSAEDKERVTNFIKKRAKDVGFVTEMFENLPFDSGFTHLRNKLIAFSKNPGDTTAKHELFHAFFSVCDNKTKTYLIQEARKILKDNGMAIKDAEEWLAESFGIYAKRKMIDLGMIKNAPKGFVDKLRNFFQKVYEYIQKFNGDRATINKIFDEVLGEKQMKDGIMDLSDLIGDKKLDKKLLREIELGDNGLRNKAVYHGSPADFDKFDSSHMGEGEGAQAHGWGHYVAVEERTGRHYAEMGKNRLEYKGLDNEALTKEYYDLNKKGEYTNRMGEIAAAKAIFSEMEGGMSFSEAKKTIKDRLEKWTKDSNNGLWEKELEEIDNIKDGDIVKKSGRNLYNLEIPDPVKADTPTGSNYWEEDGKITKSQIDKIYNEVVKEFEKKKEGKAKRVQNLQEGQLRIFKNLIEQAPGMLSDGKGLYTTLSHVLGGQKQASKFLESLGYDGIHYYGGRDGEAYVIFNDDALQIKDHIRYKKKIGDKDVEITPKVTSPDQLIEKNADGLSVMKSFISDKQAEKALDVNKVLLDKDGNPYLWTHTNKYNALQFANFENTKDSKYKEFTDKQIAWFSNSEEMSRSYADSNSKLANTKSFKNAEDFNNHFKENPVKSGKTGDGMEKVVNVKLEKEKINGEDVWVLNKQTTNVGEYNKLKDLWEKARQENWVEDYKMPKDEIEAINKIKNAIKNEYRYTIDDVKIEKKDGKYVLEEKFKPFKADTGVYGWKDEKEAMANAFKFTTMPEQYHYQGIITDVKNPLVIDLGKYGNGEIRYGKDVEGKGRYWNDLGNAYEFLKKTAPEDLKKMEGAVEGMKKLSEEHEKRVINLDNNIEKLKNDVKKEYNKVWAEYKASGLKDDNLAEKWYDVEKKNRYFDNFRGIVSEAQYSEIVGSMKHSLETILETYPEWKPLYDEANKLREASADFYKYNSEKGFYEYTKDLGIDKGAMSMLHGVDWWHFLGNGMGVKGIDSLKQKQLQTNDIVFYALRKGGYDGVLFKDIIDYGGKGDNKGGDVLAAFKSSDFKAWDNANPTDSKYISYKKKVSLDKKSEGLSKKDSNGLLAKGRERTLGNNGIRYKTNISEKDSSGKKLSEGQKKFFAGSKVVDKDGNLLRVYHGTLAGDFTVFQKYGNRASNNIASDIGFWFTPNKKGAINFAKESSWRGDNRARAEEVYLDIKNPKIYEPSEFNLKDYEERDKLIDSKYKEVYAARNEMNKYDYNHFWMGEYTHDNHVNRGIFNKLDYIYNQKGKITEADLKDIKEEYSKINWNGYYKPEIDATYEDFKNYLQAKKKYDKLNDEYLEMKHSDSYDDFKADIYKLDNKKRDKLDYALDDMDAAKKYIDNLKKEGYDGIIIKGTEYDGATLGEGARNDQYVAFYSNQIKRITNENPTKNEDIRFKRKNTDDIVGHASPYAFDKYDASKRVTGYGGQVYGAGIYTSEDLGMVAGKYGKKDADRFNSETMYKGLPLREQYDEKYVAQIMHDSMMNGLTFKEAKQEIIDAWKDTKDPNKKAMLKELGLMKKSDFDGKGNLYTYKIDKDGKWLDWQQKTSPEDVNLISKELAKINKEGAKKFDDYMKSSEYATLGQNIYQELSRALGGDQKASDFLKSIGFEGNKYKAESNKYNYVIFDYDKPINEHIRFKKQTDTPEFKKWFEGSKVVDKEGKPLEVYHGTPENFTEFKKEMIGANYGQDNQGFFFTDNKATAEDYANTTSYGTPRAEKGNVMEVYLDIKNPLVKKVDYDPIDLWDNNYEKFLKEANKNGNDGIIIKADKGESMYIPFESNQIKSATDNIGTFDKNNPDIRYKKGYHGSKSNFDKFDSNHIGEGEGAQIHGYGHYVALDKSTGEFFANGGYKGLGKKGNRNLYTVEIPDPIKKDTPTGSNYFDEQGFKLTKGQVDKILSELKKQGYSDKDFEYGMIEHYRDSSSDIYRSGDMIYRKIKALAGGHKPAQKILKKMGYDGIHYMGDMEGEGYVVFDDNNLEIKDHIRYKKGLQKKSDGLEKKRTSTASSFQGRVDAIANELGVKGGNTVQKMKRINKIIKEDKYKGTDVKKRFYQLKWEYKKQYIINNDKKIKDKGFKKTTIRVWQNGKKADWHFTKKQYDELKELGYIVE